MDVINQLTTQIAEIWGRWSRMQRIGIVAAVCIGICGILVISMWASSQEFVTLSNNLSPADAHEIVSTLQAEGIDFELNFAGSAVSVPISDVSRARIAIKETGQGLVEDDSDSGMTWWADPSQQEVRQQRIRERQLAASIEQMQSVRTARVHISPADPSPFIREQVPAKASVVLDLVPGRQFSGSDARAIVTMVSHAVENLDSENTVIVDTHGNVLSGSDQIGGDVANQLEFRRKLESDLASKAEAMLVPVLGHGRAVVRVTAAIDFTETNTARTTYDPDTKVKSKESTTTEKETSDRGAASESGTSSNVNAIGSSRLSGTLSESETIETEYQNTKIVDEVRVVPGKLLRLTVAAVVELPDTTPPETEEASAAPATKITTEQVEAIIKQAVGFDTERNDEIEVLAAKMTGIPEIAAPSAWVTSLEQLSPLARSASLGIASIIALILGLKMIARLKPVVVEVERKESLDPEVRERLADLSEEILQHPEAVSTVLSGWLSEQRSNSSGPDQMSGKAA